MWLKIFINSIIIITLVFFEISFIGSLPSPFDNFSLVIVFMIFFKALSGKYKNFWMFFLAGFIFDILYIPPIDIFILVWPLTFLFCSFLLSKVFANRSLFSFMVTCFFTTIFFSILTKLIFFIFGFFMTSVSIFLFSQAFWMALFYQIVFNLLAIVILFYVFNFLSKSLRPVFIIKR